MPVTDCHRCGTLVACDPLLTESRCTPCALAERDAYRDALAALVAAKDELRTLENREYETDEYDDGLQSAIVGALHRRNAAETAARRLLSEAGGAGVKLAVLFDGAGLARLGLEQAGHACTGFELNPVAHHLSRMVGSGNCVLADVRDVDLSGFDGVWASPPCQLWSESNRFKATSAVGRYNDPGLLEWAMGLPHTPLWVENVGGASLALARGQWMWNAAQFLPQPRQQRNRMVWGRYPLPHVYCAYRRRFPGICPAIMSSRRGKTSTQHSSPEKFHGRQISCDEAAYYQGFEIPPGWRHPIGGFTPAQWRKQLFSAIGNGVPVYMARAFGEAAQA